MTARRGAAFVGIVLGFLLLAWIRPGQVGDPGSNVLGERQLEPAAPAAGEAARKEIVVKRRPAASSDPVDEAQPIPPKRVMGVLVVDIVDQDGRPAEGAFVQPVECEGYPTSSFAGAFVLPLGACSLRAARRDGALLRLGPVTTVDVGAGEEAYVALEVSGRRTGGIGVRFESTAEGMRVLSVSHGSPAHVAGLAPGDLIVAVGGESVVGLDSQGFVDRMTGDEGTEVEFTVGFSATGVDTGGAVETIRVKRAFLEG